MCKYYSKVKISSLTLCCLLFMSSPLPSYAAEVLVPDNIAGTTKISAEDLINLLNDTPNLTIIDSRMGDRAQGYIEGSVSLPDIETSCATLSKHIKTNTTPTAFYCNGVKCGRSVKAARIALKCGYSKIYWYRGGFMDWKEKGYPFIHSK